MLVSRLFFVTRRAMLGLIPLAMLAPESRAQSTTLPITANSRLVAGWDYEFSPTANYGPPVNGVLSANYSDLYQPATGVNDGPPSALRGTMYMNGTNGSDLWTFTGPTTSASKNTSFSDADHQILTRDGSSTKLGGYGGLDTAALANNRTTGTRSKVAYVLNTEGLTSLIGVNYRTRMQADGVTASIDWSLVVGATTFALDGPITVTGAVYTTKEFSLSAVNLGGATSVTLIATVDNASTSNVMVVDNLSIYGTPAGAGAAPVITSALTASGTIGTPFNYTIAATNSPTSFGATGLPTWATINTTTGVISGTPDAAAVTSVQISATNGSGTDTKTLVITITGGAPSFTAHPANTTKLVGENATFTVAASGTPTYQWQRSTDGGTTWPILTNDATFSGTTTATLTVTGVTAAMNGHRFRAIAANGTLPDATSNAAILTVNFPPVPTAPANTLRAVGENATFTVVVTGQPTPTLKWQRSTDGGTNFTDLANDTTFSGVITPTLTVTSVTLAMNDHRFRVLASNGIGADVPSAAAILTVSGAPVFSTQPVAVSQVVGGAATFTVLAIGNPTPGYQWQRSTDGGTIWSNLANDATFGGATTATLTVSNVTLVLDGNRFRAVASNGVAPDATSNAALLTVSATAVAPTITTPPADTTKVAGQNAVFTVAVSGIPTPTLQWQRSTDGGTIWNNVTNDTTFSGATTATLTVTAVTPAMNGNRFRVIATNGTAPNATSASATLTVTLAAPVALEDVATAPDAFNARWQTVVGATAYRLDVASDTGFTAFLAGYSNLDVGNVTTVSLTNVPRGPDATETYYYRVRAVGGALTSASSNTITAIVGGRLTDVLTQGSADIADDTMIGGFVVQGGTKQVLVVAAGPALTVAAKLADPRLRVFNLQTGAQVALNDDWDGSNAALVALVQGSNALYPLATGSKDAALLLSLPAGAYTAHVETVTGLPGIAAIGIFEVDTTRVLLNGSTRAFSGTGVEVLTPSIAIADAPARVLVRAVGGTIAAAPFNVVSALTDTILEIYDSSNTKIFENDNWGTNANAAEIGTTASTIGAFTLANNSTDAAVLVNLSPGTYTFVAKGKGTAEGVVLLEVYIVP